MFQIGYLYALLFLCLMVLFLIPAVIAPRPLNIFTSSLVGGYLVIFSIGTYVFTSLTEILMQVVKNATIRGYLKTDSYYPFSINGQWLEIFDHYLPFSLPPSLPPSSPPSLPPSLFSLSPDIILVIVWGLLLVSGIIVQAMLARKRDPFPKETLFKVCKRKLKEKRQRATLDERRLLISKVSSPTSSLN